MISFTKARVFIFILGIFLIFPVTVSAKDSAIVIFDGSGSMKAQVAGKPKIEIAREVMGSLMQDWNEDVDLGLMVYGHRSKACDDIEMVIPVGTPEPSKLLEAINSINPKGETPIGLALKQAAEQLNYVESPTTVILISDGEESCNSDPCAIAKELEESGVNFTAHVIGFDVSGKDKEKAQMQLKCVAESTGGKFFEAKDAEGLKTALAETAKTIAEPKPEPAIEYIDLWVDRFERDELGADYEVIDPDEERMVISDGQLLLISTNPNKNRIVYKEIISSDFDAAVKFNMNLTAENWAGISFIADENNSLHLYVSIGSIHSSYSKEQADIRFNKTIKGTTNKIAYTGALGERKLHGRQRHQEDWYLKIEKRGFKFTAYASIDGSDWVKTGEHTLLKKTGQIALEVGSGKGIENSILIDDLTIRTPQSN